MIHAEQPVRRNPAPPAQRRTQHGRGRLDRQVDTGHRALDDRTAPGLCSEQQPVADTLWRGGARGQRKIHERDDRAAAADGQRLALFGFGPDRHQQGRERIPAIGRQSGIARNDVDTGEIERLRYEIGDLQFIDQPGAPIGHHRRGRLGHRDIDRKARAHLRSDRHREGHGGKQAKNGKSAHSPYLPNS